MPSEEAPFGASPLGPSRRQVLAGAAMLATAGVADLVHLGGIEGWAPDPDTWPLARFDAANTASTDATPPADPGVAWEYDELGYADRTALVVGSERVYAGGDGLVALDRTDGRPAWAAPGASSGRLALRDGTLYSAVADEDRGVEAGLRALEAAGGTRRWGRATPVEAVSLTVAGGTLFVGFDGGFAAVDAASGRRRWRVDTGRPVSLAVHAGDLYAATWLGSVTRFAHRDLLDVALGSGPPSRWESTGPAVDAIGPPVPTGDLVLAGQRDDDGAAGVVAARHASGAVAWTAAGDDAGRSLRATAPAVAGGIAVAGVRRGRSTEVVRGESFALSLGDGSVRWRVPHDAAYATTVAVVDGTALVGTRTTGPARAGSVRAYDLRTGEPRWRVDLGAEVTALAPVDGAVFATTHDGDVYALR